MSFSPLRSSVLTLVVLLVSVATSQAATRYISDQLVVSLRDGTGPGSTVITYLRSDQPVEVLDELDDVAKVRTAAGETGYVQKQYLVDTLPKAETIKRLQQQNERLSAKVKALEDEASMSTSQVEQDRQRLADELETAKRQLTTIQEQLNKSQGELKEVKMAYQALQKDSKNVVGLSQERDQLATDAEQLRSRVEALEDERDELLKGGAIKWFFAGSVVLFIGWVIGKMSGARRRSSLL